MDVVQIIVLALVQGLTEFLPISSSAHLVLAPVLLGWEDQGLTFDVAVHVGSLVAVVAYFRVELWRMATGWARSLAGGAATADSKLAWLVIVGTVPAALAGLALNQYVDAFRSPLVIAVTTIGFGLLLGWADRYGAKRRPETTLVWRDALLVGIAQIAALVPGTSRSGVTMTAGLWLGLTRAGAARFSFLLAVPLIAAAGLLKGLEAASNPAQTDWFVLCAATALAALSAYACIHVFLKLVERVGMLPFVIYRLLLGGVILYFAL